MSFRNLTGKPARRNFISILFNSFLKETHDSYFCVTPPPPPPPPSPPQKNHRLMFVSWKQSNALSQKKWLCVFITYVKKTFKSSSFCNISNFHNGFVWTPSKVQRSLFERIALFLLSPLPFSCNLSAI